MHPEPSVHTANVGYMILKAVHPPKLKRVIYLQCPKLSFYFVHLQGAFPIKLFTGKLLHAPSQYIAIINGSKNVHTLGAHLLKSCTWPVDRKQNFFLGRPRGSRKILLFSPSFKMILIAGKGLQTIALYLSTKNQQNIL